MGKLKSQNTGCNISRAVVSRDIFEMYLRSKVQAKAFVYYSLAILTQKKNNVSVAKIL